MQFSPSLDNAGYSLVVPRKVSQQTVADLRIPLRCARFYTTVMLTAVI